MEREKGKERARQEVEEKTAIKWQPAMKIRILQ